MPGGVAETAALLRHDPDALLVAIAQSTIVGTLIAGWDGWRCHLYRLAVEPQYRRQGVAGALVAEAARRAARRGARRLGRTGFLQGMSRPQRTRSQLTDVTQCSRDSRDTTSSRNLSLRSCE